MSSLFSHLSPTARLHTYLVIAQASFSGFQILSRIVLVAGTHPLAFTLYRNCIASILLAIAAHVREKKQKADKRTLLYLFGLGFLGVTVNQVCYLVGLQHTSAIFASAMRNSTPVFTFVISAICGIEKVELRKRHGQSKVAGSLLGLFGSILLSAYRGPVVIHSNISLPTSTAHQSAKHKHFSLFHLTLASWQIGAVSLTSSCVAFAAFLILQTAVLEKHSAPLSFAAFTCFSSTLQIPPLGLIYDRNWKSWKLGSLSEALTILYAGVIGSALVSSIQSWGVMNSGPVTVAAYQPLETIFTAMLSLIFLRENLRLGSVLGGILVIAGLYLLIWGQQKERMAREEENSLPVFSTEQNQQLYARRYSCDLETRRHEEMLTKFRRHSIASPQDASHQQTLQQQQGPLRRLSSTFTALIRSLEGEVNPHEPVQEQGGGTRRLSSTLKSLVRSLEREANPLSRDEQTEEQGSLRRLSSTLSSFVVRSLDRVADTNGSESHQLLTAGYVRELDTELSL